MQGAREPDLVDLFRVLRRHWAVVVLTTLGAVAVAYALTYFVLTPVYAASTTLIAFKRDAPVVDYATLQLHRQLVKTYGEIVKSRRVVEQVIRELRFPLGYTEFQRKIKVKLFRDTELLEIVVEDPDPYVAASTANALARVFIEEVTALTGMGDLVIVDQAVPPTKPVRPRPAWNMAVAGCVGLVLGILLGLLIEYLDNTIDSVEDVDRYLGLPTLGVIPFVRPPARAGRSDPKDRQVGKRGR